MVAQTATTGRTQFQCSTLGKGAGTADGLSPLVEIQVHEAVLKDGGTNSNHRTHSFQCSTLGKETGTADGLSPLVEMQVHEAV